MDKLRKEKLKREQKSQNLLQNSQNLKKFISRNFKDLGIKIDDRAASPKFLTDRQRINKWIYPGGRYKEGKSKQKSYFLVNPDDRTSKPKKSKNTEKNYTSFNLKTIRHAKSPSTRFGSPETLKTYRNPKKSRGIIKLKDRLKDMKNQSLSTFKTNNKTFNSFSKETQKLLNEIQKRLSKK